MQRLFNPCVVDGSLSGMCAVISSRTGFKSVGLFQHQCIQSRSRLGVGNDKRWAHVVLRPEEILPLLTPHFYKYKPFRRTTTALSSTESLPMLGFSFKASWEGGGRYLPFLFPPLFFFFTTIFIFCFLFVLQFEPNPCMLNCHTKSVLLKRRHKQPYEVHKERQVQGISEFILSGLKTAHLFRKQTISICSKQRFYDD